ncbi:hypothetical protein A8926_7025 [Saccharopolyspora spinosa]|uniref:Uncharacterized protein n=1 Tax=Saccharopolyspora spinosa TaxID=60894 RepID=A0A2N3Y7H4_SACSN|nr:hypothetical protein A8926_7025 [Saccharopolyspora spinosa]
MVNPVATGKFSLDVVLVDGRRWWVCTIGGPECGHVLTDWGQTALDALEIHALAWCGSWLPELRALNHELRQHIESPCQLVQIFLAPYRVDCGHCPPGRFCLLSCIRDPALR